MLKTKFFLLAIFINLFSNASQKHFISFIMPCYNCATTVAESIDSIYKQNLNNNFEVICTDDGSTDQTLSILLEYQKKYTNFHLYIHEVNKGGAAARNNCVAHAQGDLIFCLDSDNVLVPNSVNMLVTSIDQNKCDGAAFEEIRFFDGNYHHTHSWHFKPANNMSDINDCTSSYIVPASSGNYLYTKASYEKAQGYPEYAKALDAWGFGFRQAATGSKIAIVPNTFYWHRVTGQSYWNREQSRLNTIAYDIALEFPEIYSAQTLSYMKKCQKQNIDFMNELMKNKFNASPPRI
jgi:glycosyltransferase involved in cell wall biosynthesis